LGCQNGTKVSRYERSGAASIGRSLPTSWVFGAPSRELSPEFIKKVEKKPINPGSASDRKLSRATPTPMAASKLTILKAFFPGQELSLTKG